MIKNKAFISNTDKYDDWFDRNSKAYKSELRAFRSLGITGVCAEIGVGTGKFAKPLGVTLGVEPTPQMFEKAADLGIDIVQGVAEELPLASESFDWLMMVTTICFVNDPDRCMTEIVRALKSGGRCAIGLVDADSELGSIYLAKKDKSDFYKEATFYTATDIINQMTRAGLTDIKAVQTLTDISLSSVEEPKEGHGEGGFAVITGRKP